MTEVKTMKMEFWMILVIGLAVSVRAATVPSAKPPITQECYTAAVYEHAKYVGTPGEPATSIMSKNLEAYENATAEAKRLGADIIAFPEYGLYAMIDDKRHLVRPYLEDIPSPQERKIPCNEPHLYVNNSFVVTLSCMAKSHQIYLVANVGDMKPCTNDSDPNCPEDNAYQYNTNVAFDREGMLVSRYYKKHLYFEYKFNSPDEFLYAYFDTEFGRFASFVCFDLIFKPAVTLVEDYKVDTIVFTTWWFDGAPHMVAPQIQQAFAIANKVNLLASNIHNPSLGSIGSGIYTGANGAVNYVHSPDGKSKLLVSHIPSQSAPGKVCAEPRPSKLVNFEDTFDPTIVPEPETSHGIGANISRFALVKLLNPEDRMEACHNGLCCHLEYKVANDSFGEGDEFYLVVFNGTEDAYGHYSWAVEMCVLTTIRPKEQHPFLQFGRRSSTVFDRISLQGSFSSKYVYPSVLGRARKLIEKQKWDYEVQESRRFSIAVPDIEEPILTVSLYGRAYDRDPVYRQ